MSLRIVGEAGPVHSAGGSERSDGTVDFTHNGWRENSAEFVFRCGANGFLAQFGREIDEVLNGDALIIERGRLGGEWLRGRIPFAGDVAFLYRALLDRPDRFTGD